MNKLLIVLLILTILISSGCELITEIKDDLKEGIKNAKLRGGENNIVNELQKETKEEANPPKDLEKECKSQMNNYINLLRKKAPSTAKIELVDYKIFDNKEKALEYVDFWHSDAFKSGDGAKEDLLKEINNDIFVGVIKVDAGFVQMGFGDYSSGADLAMTFPIVCVNNSIMEGSKYTLKERIV